MLRRHFLASLGLPLGSEAKPSRNRSLQMVLGVIESNISQFEYSINFQISDGYVSGGQSRILKLHSEEIAFDEPELLYEEFFVQDPVEHSFILPFLLLLFQHTALQK